MRHLDLFSGIGGFALAAQMVGGIETQQFVEIEPYCQKVLAKNFPGVPIHGDITTYTAEPGQFDLITGGFPCFVAGTLVLTIDGYKPIESLSVGKSVLSHTGQWKPITRLMVKHDAPLREIQALGVHSIVTTDEHPFYAIKRNKQWNNADRRYEYSFSDCQWVDAVNISSKHYLSQVLPSEIQDEHSADFWKLVGLYLADGWRVKRLDRSEGNGRVVICAAKKQFEQVELMISSAGFSFSKVEERMVYKYHITNNSFYNFLAQFGHKADGKSIPGWVMGLTQEKSKALMDGLLFGDGWINSKGHARITTVSQKLAYSSALLAQKAYGCIASVFYADVPETCFIEGRKVNQKPQFTVQITFSNLEKRSFLNENYGWKRVRRNTKLGTTGTVYNISVADDNSYIANGAIVHNCQDISCANPDGRGLEGERSGLFFELMRIVRECRPRYIVLENVAALLSSNGGRDMAAVLWELSQSGFDAEWQVVSAASVGAPHLRERVFIVAYCDSKRSNNGRNRRQGRHIHADIDRTAQKASTERSGLLTIPRSVGAVDANFGRQRREEGMRLGSSVEPGEQTKARNRLREARVAGQNTWATEPGILRVANGIPRRVERIRGLGNAIVPQCGAIALQGVLDLEAAA